MAKSFEQIVYRHIHFAEAPSGELPLDMWKYYFKKGREYEREHGNKKVPR